MLKVLSDVGGFFAAIGAVGVILLLQLGALGLLIIASLWVASRFLELLF